ncbi:MAG TPA: pantetheine-phosphate adenylyltransferase [Bacteroidetes bacterium]|nr:pantetheine-phosphate adenylyltransferase [Bacteroidota bacterium]HDL18465.1 pantetheine-phosphate adenylyltransferase [Bacteroidota bacterium]
MNRIAIYPGTFDPITNGHIDIIERASHLFHRVIVAIAVNPAKQPLFSVEERREMILQSTRQIKNMEVDFFNGLVVNYAEARGAVAIVRGLRAVSDFEYELQMALMNRKLKEQVVTVFLMPHEQNIYLNSSIVKEVFSFGGDISYLVPDVVLKALQEKIPRNLDK